MRVHPEILAAQRLPDELLDAKDDLEASAIVPSSTTKQHLHRNGTRIVKFFLHLSKEEQRKRFLDRIDDPEKNWKFSVADIDERKRWDEYMKAYEACLSATSTDDAPWYVVPADDKKNARLIVSAIVLEVFNGLEMSYPETHRATPAGIAGDPQDAAEINREPRLSATEMPFVSDHRGEVPIGHRAWNQTQHQVAEAAGRGGFGLSEPPNPARRVHHWTRPGHPLPLVAT